VLLVRAAVLSKHYWTFIFSILKSLFLR